MKFSKRDVNLIFGFISLLVISVFFIRSYIPIHKEISFKENQVSKMRTFYNKASDLIKDVPEPQDFSAEYNKKLEDLKSVLPEVINDADIYTTIEYIAKETKVDLQTLQPLGSNFGLSQSDPNTNIDPNVTANQNDATTPNTVTETNTENTSDTTPAQNNTNESDGNSEENPENIPPMVENNTGNSVYEIKIRGEYRSIMMFMYRLQNLSLMSKVENFQLGYNQDIYSSGVFNEEQYEDKYKGFPLQASFNITFFSKGGGI